MIDDGALYIGADERIAAVQRRTAAPPSGFERAPRLETRGCVYPGLIDLHNHIVYNVLSLWSPPGRTEPYSSRYQWPRRAQLRGADLRPRQRARRAGRQSAPQVRRGQGGDRRGDRDPGVGQDGLPLRGLAGPQRRVRDLQDRQEERLPVGTAATHGRRLRHQPRAHGARRGVPLPRLRGHRPGADRRVRQAARRRLPQAHASAASTAPRSSRPTTASGRPAAAR